MIFRLFGSLTAIIAATFFTIGCSETPPHISAGGVHSIIQKNDRTVWIAGGYLDGLNLGDAETRIAQSTFTQARNSSNKLLSNAINVSAGYGHSLILNKNGEVWAAGRNFDGQLADGTNGYGADRPLFVKSLDTDSSLLSEVIAIAAGSYHSLVLKDDKTVWVSGYNRFGQLGDETEGYINNRNIFVAAKDTSGAVITDVVAIAAGDEHSLILKTDGSLWASGIHRVTSFNGKKIPSQSNSYIQIAENVSKIDAGYGFSIILKKDGTIWAAGLNKKGQLGDKTVIDKTTFVQLKDSSGQPISGVTAISAGASHSLILKNDKTVWAAGNNEFGQLGDGTKDNKNIFVKSLNISDIIAIDAGDSHSLIMKSDKTIWAAGDNFFGQLGDGTIKNSLVFKQVVQ